ncbi:hypothetical protein LRR81_01880 [Metabacillus sp. GX 13764]|uniref:hypothetical protein n=1 Tax=Metabacillus kandeliae TaxID=2900151 RepID=UPI001E34308D|nr:hypothetical protein [Metabacillus kandeliae]MCD7032961.1 hypothetical protein [Metabacillus kandeliae]
MSLKNLFSLFKKDDQIAKLHEKLDTVEKKLEALDNLKDMMAKSSKKEPANGTVIEEVQIKVDKFVLEKLEYNIHMGQIGIKELKGRLNIGATYGELFPFQMDEQLGEKIDEKVEEWKSDHAAQKKAENTPHVNIRAS